VRELSRPLSRVEMILSTSLIVVHCCLLFFHASDVSDMPRAQHSPLRPMLKFGQIFSVMAATAVEQETTRCLEADKTCCRQAWRQSSNIES
jgi:hypothetical protein